MNRGNDSRPMVLIACALAAVAGCAARAQNGPQIDADQAGRFDALRAAGPRTRLTLYPVQVQARPNRHVADVLGLVLEKYGMDNLDAVDAAFERPADVDWDDAPARFSGFLQQHPLKEGYGLYAEFLGEPGAGPTEVRFLVTDASGRLVLSDRQTPADADFKRTAAADPDPMGCSVLVAERLFDRLGWQRSSAGGQEGKFARLWAEKSGLPSPAERAAMEKRAAALKADLAAARITVYATRVGDSNDVESAARLAAMLPQKLGCQAGTAERGVEIDIQPTSNQMKRLWDLARGFRAHLAKYPPDTGYALMAAYQITPGGKVWGVYWVLCDKSGDWVLADMQNNQHSDFQRLAPTGTEDCDRLTVERLAHYVR